MHVYAEQRCRMKRRGIATFILIIVVFLSACNRQSITDEAPDDSGVHKVSELLYGVEVDSLSVIRDQVKRNEFLADILLEHGVDYNVIDYIARNTRETFDVRKIKYGNNYCVIRSNDSIPTTLYFAYEITPSSYVLYHLRDSIYAELGKKEIRTVLTSTTGIIKSSLWNSLVNADADPNLANELSEIYAWTIDFFGLQKGDTYKAIYETHFVDDAYTGLGKVIATVFNHGNKDLYAFYFEQNEKGDYFDIEGNSLQRTFLKAPLRYSRISSGFSNSRLHPVLKIRRPHHGVDYAAPTGTPVYTVGDGVVIQKGYQKSGGGNYIKIKHNGTYTTVYMHLSGFAKGIKVGQHVKQGDLIGFVGSTGLSTGPHLDFRFYRNGSAINPLKVESPPSKPIEEVNRAKFDSIVNQYLPLIEALK